MAIVDERGRLFGRWNLLDLAVLILLIGLIPIAYGAYLLFRDRPPTVTSVTPNPVEEIQEFQLTIKGTNLRPYMRVSVGTHQARDFVFKSTEEALLPFSHIAPGTYDVVLYDSAQERFRLKDALTITPSTLPSTEIIAIGAFGNLDAAGAAKLTAGTELPGFGRVLSVGRAVPDLTQVFSGAKIVGVLVKDALRLPAVVLFKCRIRSPAGTPVCSIGDVNIAPPFVLNLATPLGQTPFQIERVRSTHPVEPVPVEVRVVNGPPVLSLIRPGDVDLGGTTNELSALARVVAAAPDGPGALNVSLVAQLQKVDGQWLYDSVPLRIGTPIMLRTNRYETGAVVTKLPPPN